MARTSLGNVFHSWAPRNARQPLPNLVETGGWRRPMVECNLVGPADEGTRRACSSESNFLDVVLAVIAQSV